MDDFIMDRLLPTILLLMFLGLFGAIGGALFDGLQSYRATPAEIACRAARSSGTPQTTNTEHTT